MTLTKIKNFTKSNVITFLEAYDKPQNKSEWFILMGVTFGLLGLYYTLKFMLT